MLRFRVKIFAVVFEINSKFIYLVLLTIQCSLVIRCRVNGGLINRIDVHMSSGGLGLGFR